VHSRGFTLIELMIVVAIIGVMASVTIPSYLEYVARSKVAEVLSVSSNAKNAMTEYIITNGAYPSGATQAGIVLLKTTYLDEMTVNDSGRISMAVDATNVGINLQLHLQATAAAFGVTWVCTSTGETQYAPGSCRVIQ